MMTSRLQPLVAALEAGEPPAFEWSVEYATRLRELWDAETSPRLLVRVARHADPRATDRAVAALVLTGEPLLIAPVPRVRALFAAIAANRVAAIDDAATAATDNECYHFARGAFTTAAMRESAHAAVHYAWDDNDDRLANAVGHVVKARAGEHGDRAEVGRQVCDELRATLRCPTFDELLAKIPAR